MILPKRFFAVRLIRYSDQAKSTWKNWGGTTREIGKLHPPNETSYLWRASNADVSSSGPFSDFTGYDRILLFLSGSGLKLTFPTITWTLQLPLIEQVHFRGETPCHCDLLGTDPVSDWNFIWRRDRGTALVYLHPRFDPNPFQASVVYSPHGRAQVVARTETVETAEEFLLDKGDALVVDTIENGY